MTVAPLLSAHNVSKRFGGHHAVDGMSFSIAPGAITGLIGPNGAGKTTLFNCLAGFLKPTSGRIQLNGRDVTGLPPHRLFSHGLARTFQIPRLFPEMTVLENAAVAARDQPGERFWNVWFRPALVAQQERRIQSQARHWLDFVKRPSLRNCSST